MNTKSLFAAVSLLAAMVLGVADASAAERNNADLKPAAPATTKLPKEMQGGDFMKMKFGMFMN